MNTATEPDPKELRPLLHAEIDRMPDEHLVLARRLLVEMEARCLMDELDAATDQAWADGKISEELISSAIREHRALHPYR